jgi:hypothetical protein
MERDLVTVCAGDDESVADMVKLDVPAVVGVPLIAPVLGSRLSPAGSMPELNVQV